MRIAILGAGFTGLTAAYRLLQKGHQVTLIEKEKEVGGLAGGFKLPTWKWSLEKAYHHWFTNDSFALNLAKELNYPVIIKRPQTEVFIKGDVLPLDSPTSLLKFPYLSPFDRLRVGLTLFYLKTSDTHKKFEGKKALPWIRKYMGNKSAELIWEPLFSGKFERFREDIALTWFWARIFKRTPSLAYPEGGFLSFAQRLESEIKNLGGEIFLNTEVQRISNKNGHRLLQVILGTSETRTPESDPPRRMTVIKFDKIISTLPSPVFTKITSGIPKAYAQKVNSIPHLHAQNLILVLNKPFMKNTYWLNITQKDFPFLVLAEHTNFMDKKYYGKQHILYIGNYLPSDHPFLKLSAKQLLNKFTPYLSKINPNFKFSILNFKLFTYPFAQPVVTTKYPKLIPSFNSPIKNLYVANMDMVYPWDRGTNYAIEMGEKIAKLVNNE